MNTIKDPNTIWTTLAGLTSEDFTCTAWRRRRCEGADDVNMFADDTPLRILNKDSCCFEVYSRFSIVRFTNVNNIVLDFIVVVICV